MILLWSVRILLRTPRDTLAHELKQDIVASSCAEHTTGLKEVHAVNFPSYTRRLLKLSVILKGKCPELLFSSFQLLYPI